MKTKEEIITSMCYTYRHDYGAPVSFFGDSDIPICGMTDEQRQALYNTMKQIFQNDIEPYMTINETKD